MTEVLEHWDWSLEIIECSYLYMSTWLAVFLNISSSWASCSNTSLDYSWLLSSGNYGLWRILLKNGVCKDSELLMSWILSSMVMVLGVDTGWTSLLLSGSCSSRLNRCDIESLVPPFAMIYSLYWVLRSEKLRQPKLCLDILRWCYLTGCFGSACSTAC